MTYQHEKHEDGSHSLKRERWRVPSDPDSRTFKEGEEITIKLSAYQAEYLNRNVKIAVGRGDIND